jgi:hypothetical protein
MRLVRLSAAGLLAALLTGCGGDDGKGGTFNGVEVSGTVTYDGQPVEDGLVTVTTDDGKSSSAKLEDGGKFTLPNAPTGPVKIGVNTQMAKAEAMMNQKESKGKMKVKLVEVPAKYAQPSTSGLTDTITAGKPLDIKINK